MPSLIIRIPWMKANGMALFPFILVRLKNPSPTLLNHERIHLRQQLELLIIPFYIWYLLEYGWNRLKYKDHYYAYRKISFEAEAFAHDQDLSYLKKRRFWGFLRYFWFLSTPPQPATAYRTNLCRCHWAPSILRVNPVLQSRPLQASQFYRLIWQTTLGG